MQKQQSHVLADTISGPRMAAPPSYLALIPAGLAFVLYFVTLSPTINFTDSGELVTVAWTEGIAHPPGYPLYTIVGSLFAHLPLGDPAWRMNLLSALFAALGVGLFYSLITETITGMAGFQRTLTPRPGYSRTSLSPSYSGEPPKRSSRSARVPSSVAVAKGAGQGRKAASDVPATLHNVQAADFAVETRRVKWAAVAGGLAGSGLLAVSLTFWNWGTQAKFYSLHYALVAAILWIALLARRAVIEDVSLGSPNASATRFSPGAWPPATRLLHLLAFTVGLSLTNHFLTFLLLPGIAILLLTPLRYAREMLRRVGRHAGTLVLATLLPLLLYLYLPLRAGAHPLISWGLTDTWGNFWRQVTAQSYQGFFGTADLGNHFVDAVIYAANQFGPWLGAALLAPVAVGVMYLWRVDRGLLAATVVVALVDMVIVLNYNIREIVTYYVPLYMVVLWWAGLGVTQGVLWLQNRASSASAVRLDEENSPIVRVPRNFAATLVLGAALPLVALALNLGVAGHRDNYTAELFVRNAFRTFQPNAVVLTNYWDLTSASFYLQHVLGERQDVTVIDKSLLRSPFYLDYLERNYPQVVSKNTAPFSEYRALLLQWIDTGKPPSRLSAAYINMLNGFIDSNLGQQPVYAEFIAEANDPPELQEIRALYADHQGQLVPNSFGYRISSGTGAEDLRAKDPQPDLRGVTVQRVPLDEIEASVVALYPASLSAVGTYMQKSAVEADREMGARLLAQAQELQSLSVLRDARPRLR